MADKKITFKEVAPAIKEFMQDGESKSYAELSTFIKTSFEANDAQTAGLLKRLTSKKVISRLKEPRGYYVIYGNSSILEGLSDDLEILIKSFRKTLIAESVNPEVSNEDIIKLREILPKLDGIHKEIEDYTKR